MLFHRELLPEGVIIFDESGFLKKGNDSIGVSKQYCGSIGKVENCQVGVFTAYASSYGYALLDKRLLIPGKCFSGEYKLRRKKCNLPEEIIFKTKLQLAIEMLNNIVENKTIQKRIFQHIFRIERKKSEHQLF